MAQVSIDLVFDDSEISKEKAVEIYFKAQESEREVNHFKTKDGNVYIVTKFDGDGYNELPYTRIELWNPELIEI